MLKLFFSKKISHLFPGFISIYSSVLADFVCDHTFNNDLQFIYSVHTFYLYIWKFIRQLLFYSSIWVRFKIMLKNKDTDAHVKEPAPLIKSVFYVIYRTWAKKNNSHGYFYFDSSAENFCFHNFWPWLAFRIRLTLKFLHVIDAF